MRSCGDWSAPIRRHECVQFLLLPLRFARPLHPLANHRASSPSPIAGAEGLDTFTLVFPDPDWQQISQDDFDKVDVRHRANASISFEYAKNGGIRTLSAGDASPGDKVSGLLYVPLLASPSCESAVAPFIPPNETRRSDLPRQDYDLIALAPWTSPRCTLEFLDHAHENPFTRAFLFYLPDNRTDTPPLTNDPVWSLGDGGQWKSDNKYPVYALPGLTGAIMMNALAQYSGNLTTVPHGHELANYYHPSAYVRLFSIVDTGSGTTMPSLWVFLLIVLGILIFIIGLTSAIMHWLQRERRRELRRRVANGEVDLEALGIKRLTVPQELLGKLPLYTYTVSGVPPAPEPTAAQAAAAAPPPYSADGTADSPASPLTAATTPAATAAAVAAAAATTTTSPPASPSRSDAPPSSSSNRSPQFAQPTCAICLDDFEPGVSQVRELPCQHIFHPDCVDPFLRDNSSLCPLCKKSVLPRGYCPTTVTNAMVRRERLLRRIRERVAEDGS
ncbi:hypothetical protein BDY21DRAFT_292890, partial [Lineolata rhizophorae]